MFHVLASNKKVFTIPGGEPYQNFFATSVDPRYAEVGQNSFIVPSTWDDWEALLEQVFSKNDVVYLTTGVSSEERAKGKWFESDESMM